MSAKAAPATAVVAKEEVPMINPIDSDLITKAATSLLQHLKSSARSSLFEDSSAVFLEFRLKRMPGRELTKPVQIPLPHTLLNPEDGIEVCLFVKDASVDAIKEQLVAAEVGGFTRVLGVGKLKKRYREFKDRRELVAGYSAFFCDDRCITMMPKLCGKAFFARNKAPMPVRLTGTPARLGEVLARARDSTWLRVGAQTVGLRVGRGHFTPAQLAANMAAALGPAVDALPRKWRGVQSVYLRGLDTVGLPLYKALPSMDMEEEEEGQQEGEGEEEEDSEEEDEEEGLLLEEDSEEEEEEERVKKAPVPKKQPKGNAAAAAAAAAAPLSKRKQRQAAGSAKAAASAALLPAPKAAAAAAAAPAAGKAAKATAATTAAAAAAAVVAGKPAPKPSKAAAAAAAAPAAVAGSVAGESAAAAKGKGKGKAAAAASQPPPQAEAPAAAAAAVVAPKSAKGSKGKAEAVAATAAAAAAVPAAAASAQPVAAAAAVAPQGRGKRAREEAAAAVPAPVAAPAAAAPKKQSLVKPDAPLKSAMKRTRTA